MVRAKFCILCPTSNWSVILLEQKRWFPQKFYSRPYLIFGVEEAVKEAQKGGSGVVIYFRKEGRALGEVTKYLVYNARMFIWRWNVFRSPRTYFWHSNYQGKRGVDRRYFRSCHRFGSELTFLKALVSIFRERKTLRVSRLTIMKLIFARLHWPVQDMRYQALMPDVCLRTDFYCGLCWQLTYRYCTGSASPKLIVC